MIFHYYHGLIAKKTQSFTNSFIANYSYSVVLEYPILRNKFDLSHKCV